MVLNWSVMFMRIVSIGIVLHAISFRFVLLRELQANGVPLNKKSIAVITTYSGQEVFLRSVIDKKVDVYTIDKSQGQERDIIILSMVRSNSEGKLGFICDPRRINVALTRARNGLIIVCNTHTLARDKRTWAYYLDWAKEHHLLLDTESMRRFETGLVASS